MAPPTGPDSGSDSICSLWTTCLSMETKLEAKPQLLKLYTREDEICRGIGNIEKITRHKETLGKIEDLKLHIEKGKLEEGNSIDEVEEWGKIIE